MASKRPHSDLDDAVTDPSPSTARAKRPRPGPTTNPPAEKTSRPATEPRTGADLLSPLSDELLVRVLSFLSLPQLLTTAPVSRRFHRLSEDSQLWKALYYARFVLPRAMRIPGFRDTAGGRDHKLHYSGRRALWADGRRGGLVADQQDARVEDGRIRKEEEGGDDRNKVHWKGQYKLRHNWAKGKCAVEELRLGTDDLSHEDNKDGKMIVKVIEGLAITADKMSGLRAWDLKTREVVSQISPKNGEGEASPSCIAIDDNSVAVGTLDISVGFADGSFGVWRLDMQSRQFIRRYRHEKSSNGELVGMAYSHPYLLTATASVLISLYTFDVPEIPEADDADDEGFEKEFYNEIKRMVNTALPGQASKDSRHGSISKVDGTSLPAPYLITSLKSNSSDPPLALSIRKMATSTIASIAYTFSTRQGWSIGIQDLQITPSEGFIKAAPIITTRLAYTNPVSTSDPSRTAPVTSPRTPRSRILSTTSPSPSLRTPVPAQSRSQLDRERGPTTLCYTHPYLLATLPDNTLILHLCTSNASALSISPGIRLWGHTSGISDAEITARGKAVSVSSRGDEMRVWELEGRPSGLRSRSVEIRPGASGAIPTPVKHTGIRRAESDFPDWDERRNWVGFDDEMVIVLKESKGGRESLMVYDFT